MSTRPSRRRCDRPLYARRASSHPSHSMTRCAMRRRMPVRSWCSGSRGRVAVLELAGKATWRATASQKRLVVKGECGQAGLWLREW
jgi:hypothetical protein